MSLQANHANASFEAAYALRKLERYPEALAAYKRTLQIANPDYSGALYEMGWIYNDQKNYMAALSSLRHAIDIKPEYPDAHSELGYSYRQLNRNQEAIQEYQIALQQKPDHGLAYLGLADVYYYNTKQYREAADAYRKGLRLRPGSATSNFNLGWCLNDLQQYSEATTVLREAIRIKSEYAEAHNELGYALLQLNRYPEAVQELSTAISQRKDYALAHDNWVLLMSRWVIGMARCRSIEYSSELILQVRRSYRV